jgi:hypothetical protein
MNVLALKFKRVSHSTIERHVGKKINKGEDRYWGCCDIKKDVAYIRSDLFGRDSMEAEIHESMHAILPNLTEDQVSRVGEVLSYLMYDKLGYRKIAKR